ncbi:putative ribonuclease H-like domain-containing protein [Tanacetum coccineum]
MRTRRSKVGTVMSFANLKRQFQARREVSPPPINNIYTFYESESSESDTKNVDIESLTLEQYLALDQNNTRRRFTYPDDSTFEIKGQLLRELRKISFSGCPTDSVVEHISNVLEIASIFNAQESTLVQRFCPPAMIFKQLSEIQNFKQEDGESLFSTWERYNDLLFKCPFHDLNDHQKVNTFYNGLNSQTRQTVDTNGLIHGLTASDALKSFQKLVEHSHKWHCKENHTTTPDPLRIITKKLKLLNHEMEELTVDFRKLNMDDVRRSYYAKVKRRILEENKEPTTTPDKPKQQLQKVVSHKIKESPTHYSVTRQNKLPPKETDPESFILPCIIGNHSMSNALADLGASISIMTYSLFKRLGLGQHVNTASPDVNTGSLKLNVVGPSVNTASSNEHDSPEDMFTMGVSSTLEATHIESFSDEDEPEVDLGNITNSYTVPTTPNTRIHKDHPIDNVIGDVKSSVQTRRMTKPTSEQGFLSDVWILLDLSNGKKAIGTKWVFKNKKDKRGIVIRNKVRLVAQGHRQEEGIDYEEVFAPVARIEAIRLVLAYASFMGFLVYQMDVKSAFLYATIEEEVYVTQPPGFKDPDHPDKVYKVVKALYGLHQAPRAWYETLANYLLGNGFKRGKIDQTLFIKKQKGDILLVQVYVDDIIFGSTNKELLQQKEDGIFISQDKYVAKILKKFNYYDVKSTSTPVDLEKPLVKDEDADDVDVHLYRSMIVSLMYLTASRQDIMFAVCACAKFQVTPKTSHLLAVKRIFRYLKGKPTLGLWYSRDSLFKLVAYTDSDYARATQDKKSTTGGYLITKGFDAGRFQYLVSSMGMLNP